MAMDVDEEEDDGDSTQRLRRVPDYGIEVDFEILSANEREVSAVVLGHDTLPFSYVIAPALIQNPSGEVLGEFDASIAKLNAEIERMTPNMKAMDRHVFYDFHSDWYTDNSLLRLDDVEVKLAETEKEAEKARKDSKSARDTFNDVKQRRYGLTHHILPIPRILKFTYT
jgi:structural maintenance of chromosome 1